MGRISATAHLPCPFPVHHAHSLLARDNQVGKASNTEAVKEPGFSSSADTADTRDAFAPSPGRLSSVVIHFWPVIDMSFTRVSRTASDAVSHACRRTFATRPPHFTNEGNASSSTSAPTSTLSAPPPQLASGELEPLTHYKITLRRSAISLPQKFKDTVAALGLTRRHQTVFQRHTPEAAGMILRVKELLEVSNVPTSQVRTGVEQREERKASRGYEVVGRAVGTNHFA
jgi:large subunit ribosomal protein L30